MPEFKLNGKTYSGSTNYASAISYTEDDGSKTTVQDKISELNSNLNDQNKNLIGFPNYEERITLTSSNLNNIPKDGFFTYSIRPQNDRVVSITVNNVIIQKFLAKGSSNTDDGATSCLIPVKAGDVVSYNNNVNNASGSIYASGSYLYPMR